MDKLRRSLRQSFRRRSPKESSDDPAKPYHWQKDEAAVRAGTCSFTVKYLGCVEVYESRGMQVCEEALKVLRNSRRRNVKGVLYVSGDGLRVVDADNKGLLVDQTIEKVSFCAPDRNHEKGFAYICRDGTTRRWMCHGFVASKDSGERLSHAVGCAFAVCLEQKQKRDREAQLNVQLQSSNAVPGAAATAAAQTASSAQTPSSAASSTSTANQPTVVAQQQQQSFDSTNSAQRSFRRVSLTERKQDPQNVIPAEKPPVKPTSHPNAVARPTANKALFERQGSLRLPASSNPSNIVGQTDSDSFRRFNSLRLNQLPSNLARNQQHTHSSSNAGVGAIWEGEESSLSELSLQMSLSNVNARTNGFNSPSHTNYISEECRGHSSRWDKSFVANNNAVAVNESFSPPRASSVVSSSSNSKAEEWLKTATNQAKMLQQYNRQTPPNQYGPSPSFNSSPALAGSNSGGESSSGSPQHWAAYNNALEQLPPTPSHHQSSVPLQHRSVDADSNAVTTAAHRATSGGWHQSISFDVVDTFDNKWESLPDKRRHSSSVTNSASSNAVTNPFSQESNAVRI